MHSDVKNSLGRLVLNSLERFFSVMFYSGLLHVHLVFCITFSCSMTISSSDVNISVTINPLRLNVSAVVAIVHR